MQEISMPILKRILSSINRPNSSEARLLRIEVSKSRLLHNITQFKNRIGDREVAAVLKSNAYGHGLIDVGLALDNENLVSTYCVDSIVEARLLRANNVNKPIIILGYIPRAGISELKHIQDTTPLITSLNQARSFSELVNFPINVHIKVDTGMRRNGIMPNELCDTVCTLSNNRNISITGIATHLADADNANDEMTLKQIESWKKFVSEAKKLAPSITSFHFAATSGTAYINQAKSTLIRLGLGMYGFDTVATRTLKLRPALSFVAKIINKKTLSAGESIGYNFTHTAMSDREIAIIPAGYQEGINRMLSNVGNVKIHGQFAPIIGRVSMNLTAIDVTNILPSPNIEVEVEIVSNIPDDLNSVISTANLCETIPYEMLTSLPPGVRREIVN